MKKIEVSVLMITYGHENYISEAIEGVFAQKTTFPVELIIANDASPDDSDRVILEKIKSAPDNITIKYTRHPENIGIMPNFNWILAEAQGKYIAVCEGDDYWTDPQKLQKQFDFLEKESQYVACGGLAKVVLEGDHTYSEIYGVGGGDFGIKDFLTVNNLVTCTVMFRNTTGLSVPHHHAFGDWTIYMQLLKGGRAYVFNEVFAVYRRHGSGAMQKVQSNYHLHYATQYAYNLRMSEASLNELSSAQKEIINQAFFQHFLQEWRGRNYISAVRTLIEHYKSMKKNLGYRRYLNFVKLL